MDTFRGLKCWAWGAVVLLVLLLMSPWASAASTGGTPSNHEYRFRAGSLYASGASSFTNNATCAAIRGGGWIWGSGTNETYGNSAALLTDGGKVCCLPPGHYGDTCAAWGSAFDVEKQYRCLYGSDTTNWYAVSGRSDAVVQSLCGAPPGCAGVAGTYASGAASGAGMRYYDWGTDEGNTSKHSSCHSGCVAIFTGTFPAETATQGGARHYYAQGGYQYLPGTGQACTAGDDPTPVTSKPADTCGPNEDGGTVNGVFTCVNRFTGEPVDQNDRNRDGKPDDCQPGTFHNSDGSTYTRTWNAGNSTCTTTASGGGSCVGTSCGNGAGGDRGEDDDKPSSGGGGGGSDDEDSGEDKEPGDDQKAFCEENPTSLMCTKQTTGGACGAFTCTGDAALCAIAKANFEMRCTMLQTTTTLSDLGNQVASGADPMSATLPSPAHPTEVAIGGLDSSPIWGASCPSSISTSLMGHGISIPTDTICTFAGILGNLFLASCGIAAAFIIGRG